MPDQLTVDDVLKGREGLRERAHKARTAELATKAAIKEHTFWALCGEARKWMRDELGMSEGDIADIEFEQTAFNPDTPEACWLVDGMRFKVRYKTITTDTITNGDGTKFEIKSEEPVFDFMARAFRSSAWKPVKTLADVGANL